MSKSETLLPCPFCGGPAEIERLGDRRSSTIYQCQNCGCGLETGEEWEHGTAWNTRFSSDCYDRAVSPDIAAAATRVAVREALAQAERIALIHVEAYSDPLSITDSAKRFMAHRLWDDIRALAATYAEPKGEGE